jgi:hypothetical protein
MLKSVTIFRILDILGENAIQRCVNTEFWGRTWHKMLERRCLPPLRFPASEFEAKGAEDTRCACSS